MYAWSVKRRLIYGGSVVVFISIISSLFYFGYLYKAPTCNDGIRNGDEKGVDCGGVCKNICTSDTLSPAVLWSKVFNISGDFYTAVSYIQNPNISSKNQKASYKFKIYDDKNKLILEKTGYTSIPKNKKFAVFESGLIIKDKKPKTAEFEFSDFSSWQKDIEKEPELFVEHSVLLSTSTVPRITGKIYNKSSSSIRSVELDVFVLDSKENVVAASQSFVDDLIKGTSQDFVFTWPKPFNLGVESCLQSLDVVVALDKSGSMKSESIVPPEPFSTVISSAQSFIKNLTDEDQVGVVSFGDLSKKESEISFKKDDGIKAVSNLDLGTTSEQTNITAGLTSSLEELQTDKVRNDSKKVIVLLTDGEPTEPKNKQIQDFPIISAQKVADDIKKLGIEIYTIGLGKNVNDGFLKSIATSDDYYFYAPAKETLSGIYNRIISGICQKKPNVITVVYRVL